MLTFLGLASVLAVAQNLVGVGLAACLGVPWLLGLMCGSVALSGGHGTMMGFAPTFESAGLAGAVVIGAAAATFGIVAGGLLGGPVGSALIRGKTLCTKEAGCRTLNAQSSHATGILHDLRRLSVPHSRESGGIS